MATFTPSNAVDMSKERDWPAQLGMLDWDNTNIVFTKRSLIEFLKYTGITVDPNFTNIQKLPRYAQFGKLSGDVAPAQEVVGSTSASSTSPSAPASTDFKPTRRVREPPGGAHHGIFGPADDDDALSKAPPKPVATEAPASPEAQPEGEADVDKAGRQPNIRSRRTTSTVANLWDAPDDAETFKPTRRVREMPGGKDSISGLF